MSEEEKKLKKAAEPRAVEKVRFEEGLSTGSTLLNLACTGRPNVGYLPGHFYFLVGSSRSGKTWFSLSGAAEACMNKRFDDYRFIYDNAENGALMDVRRYFGKRMAARLEPPSTRGGEAYFSDTIEDFYFHVDDAIEAGRPFYYVLDSMDALSSKDEQKKFGEYKKSFLKAKAGAAAGDDKGSYGDGKAKKNSANLRRVIPHLRRTGSILIIINQSRDKIGAMPFEEKETRAGGRALTFYAALEIWTKIVGKVKKKINDVDREVGAVSRLQVKKNRVAGRPVSVDVPIHHRYGIDDISSCIDFLIKEGHWSKGQGGVVAPEFNFRGSAEKLGDHIDSQNEERKLQQLVADVWQDIEDKMVPKRKPRYT